MNIKRILSCILLTYLSYYAFFSNYATLFMPVQHFGGAVFIVAVFLVYYRHDFSRIKKGELIFATLLSMAHIIGLTFTRYDSFGMFTTSWFGVVFFFLLLIGFTAFFYVIACLLVDKILCVKIEPGTSGRFDNFLAPFLLFLAAWLPYLFIYFPGTLINDAVRQLSQFMGVDPFSNHHPVVSSLFMGVIFRFGLIFGGGNVGLFFITIVHNLMMAAAFSLTLRYLKKWGVAYNVRLVVMIFYAFFPVFGVWAQTILKDTHSSVIMLLFVLCYIDVIRNYSRKKLALVIVTAILASLLRNEVVFVVVPCIIALALVHRSAKMRICMFAMGGVVFISVRLIVSGVMAVTDATEISAGVTFSVPFQQTARFMRYHEITEEERAVMAATFYDYYMLGDVYQPRISDPVIFRFIEGADMGAYFRAWASMGRRAPLTFLEAAVAVSFSYVVPFGPDWLIIWHDASHSAIPDLGRDDISYVFSNYAMRVAPLRVIQVAERLPIIGFFFHTGNYTWAMAFMVLLLVKRKEKRAMLYFLPALMIVLACMASPVHGFWRYYLPVLFMFPALVSLVVMMLAGENKKNCL